MTVSEFCADRNISCHAYYYWLRKIREYITGHNPAGTEFVQLPSSTGISSPAPPGTITIRIGSISVELEGSVGLLKP